MGSFAAKATASFEPRFDSDTECIDWASFAAAVVAVVGERTMA